MNEFLVHNKFDRTQKGQQETETIVRFCRFLPRRCCRRFRIQNNHQKCKNRKRNEWKTENTRTFDENIIDTFCIIHLIFRNKSMPTNSMSMNMNVGENAFKDRPTFNISIAFNFGCFMHGTTKKLKKFLYHNPAPIERTQPNRQKYTTCSTCHFQCEHLTVTTGFSFFRMLSVYAKRTHDNVIEWKYTEIVCNNLQLLVDRYDKQVLPTEYIFFCLAFSLFWSKTTIIMIIHYFGFSSQMCQMHRDWFYFS